MLGMRRLLLVLVVACGSPGTTPPDDGGVDGGIDAPPGDLVRYCREHGTLCAPLGTSCNRDYSPLCNYGFSWCSPEGTCEPFCGEGVDRCDDGTEIHESTDDDSDVCYCAR